MNNKLAENIYWVGAINFEDRNIHGYKSNRGTTYNAYLIIDEKVTLIDAVKEPFQDEMMRRISQIIDPSKIDYIVSLHGEPDHSGAIFAAYDAASSAEIVASKEEHATLQKHYHRQYNETVIKTGDILKLGKYSLEFVSIPMVHWPDSTVAYLKEEKILFSSDAFGQHLASHERYDDEYPLDIIKEEMKKYFANIVLPYVRPVGRAMEVVAGLDINIIATAHGLMWRNQDNIKMVQQLYKEWANHVNDNAAIVLYDTMWGSTKKMAYAIVEVLEQFNIPYRIFSLHNQTDDISDIMPHLMTAKYVFVGSSNYNGGILPNVAGFLSYVKGFNVSKIGMAFTSYGWVPLAYREIEAAMKQMKWTTMPTFLQQYVPTEDQLEAFKQHIKDSLNAIG